MFGCSGVVSELGVRRFDFLGIWGVEGVVGREKVILIVIIMFFNVLFYVLIKAKYDGGEENRSFLRNGIELM